MRVAASDISTQDTSADIAMQVTNYMTMKCPSSDIELLAFWQQHSRRFPMLSKLAASVPVEQCSELSRTENTVLNNWSHSERQAIGAGKLNRISFIHDNYAYLVNSE